MNKKELCEITLGTMIDVTEGESIKAIDISWGAVSSFVMFSFLASSRAQNESAVCLARMSCGLLRVLMRAFVFIVLSD